MIQKIIDFLIRKKLQSATGEISQVSKTKIFMLIEGVLRLVEFVTPFFGHAYTFPDHIHQLLYALAGMSYAERQIVK